MTERSVEGMLTKRAMRLQRGAVRAAVLGMNDGLVSVLCLVLAVAGAGASSSAVLLAGFAGLLAGAISMAAGEWISVRSQAELFSGLLKDIDRLAHKDNRAIGRQLASKLEASGYSEAIAADVAIELQKNDHLLRDTYAREVAGFNPTELGSPWTAAFSSFILFTLGALAPLAPWFFVDGLTAVAVSLLLTSMMSLLIGGFVGISRGRGVFYGAFRQLFIVALASVVTYGAGYLFGGVIG